MSESKGNAPKITPEHIDSIIVACQFWQPVGTTLTVCVMKLKNGTLVVGESACVSDENFVKETGEEYAYANVFDKVWALEGYKLKEALYQQSLVKPVPASVILKV